MIGHEIEKTGVAGFFIFYDVRIVGKKTSINIVFTAEA